MKRVSLAGAAAAAMMVSGCMSAGSAEPVERGPALASAEAQLMEPGGRPVARSTATQVGDSVRVRIEAAGLARGTYGAHVHMTGRCDPPGFESAGAHWNPTARQHGSQNPNGQHRGDLPNLMVGADGRGRIEYTIPNVSLAGPAMPMLLDGDGAAIVIHAGADDYRTDPSGNSGARIACGVLR